MNYKRRVGGKKAQHNGAQFEALFATACARQAIIATRIPDGCKQTKIGLIRVKSPFDWVLSFNGTTALIDTKTIAGKSFPNSLIDTHQALTLVRHDIEGTKAGYVMWLRQTDEFVYVSAKILCQAMQSRGSLGPDTPGVKKLGINPLVDLKLIFTD